MKKIIILTVVIFAFTNIFGQSISPELVSSAGDNFETDSYQLSWSIGEVVTDTWTEGGTTITQGFHQNTYELIAIEDLTGADLRIDVFPNPSSDLLNISIENLIESNEFFSIKLNDLQGRNFIMKQISDSNTEIDMSDFASGVYLLNVYNSTNQSIKLFKIVKK
jgi:hypothetical protein